MVYISNKCITTKQGVVSYGFTRSITVICTALCSSGFLLCLSYCIIKTIKL